MGILTAAQARINGQLGLRVDDGLVAAFISFGSGLVVVGAVSLALPAGRRGFARLSEGLRTHSIPPWMVLGGVAGAVTVATQGLTVGMIGVSLFTVGVIAGQALCGVVLDRIGFGPAGKVVVTLGRLGGVLLALGAVGVSLSGDVFARTPAWMLLLPFAAGLGIAWQQATNGRLGAKVGTPLTATLVNFIGGAVVLGIAAVLSVWLRGPIEAFPTEPWLYVGGTMGVIYIFLSSAIVARIGVLVMGLGAVVGQMLTSVLLDALWPASGGPQAWQASIMIVLALASVTVAAAPWRARRSRA